MIGAFRAATLVLVVGCLWLALSALANEPGVSVTVEGGHFRTAPAYIRLRVRVQPDRENRALEVRAVSDHFETSSYEQLSGTQAPRTRWIEWKDVPEGVYTVMATVSRGAERPWRDSAGFEVR